MIRSIRILSTLVLVSGILSCNKHKDSNSKANEFRLSKLIQWSSASPSKNIVTNEFLYDDQKRLVEIATFNGDSVNGEIQSAKYRSIKFFYNGADKNPNKTTGSMSNFINVNTETYYSYNANGALIRDSIPAAQSYPGIVRNYFYSSDKIVVQSKNPIYSYDQSKDSFAIADHNLVTGFLYMSLYSTQASGYKMIYDNKVNPISKLNIASLTTVTGPIGFPSFLAPGFCKNNITEYTTGNSTGPGNFTGLNTYYYTYSYSENNLPVECRMFNNNSNNIVKYYYID
jgi:hypothetical protein